MDGRPVLSCCTTTSTMMVCRRLLSCIFLFSFSITLSNGYNLDTSSPIIHRSSETGSLFGFSVAQHSEGNTKWLIVGAPNSNSTINLNTIRDGAVYRCPVAPLDNPGRCTKVDFDREDVTAPLPNIRNDQWLGASVASSGPDGIVVACAPRFVWRYSPDASGYQDEPVGRCHSVKNNFLNFESYSPCHTNRGTKVGHSGVTHCQAGMSIDIDAANNELFLGAPGSFYWQGQGILLDLNFPSIKIASNQERSLTFDDSYRGYSVAFLTLADGTKNFVLGVPRGDDLQGLVQILSSIDQSTEVETFRSDQMGSYFGQALAVTDLNGDGREDLIISAPLYVVTISSQKKWEAGQVYIYYQTSLNRFTTGVQDTLSGTKTKARFGFSLAAVGDTNLDGFNDLAVGAPYDGETGAGLVYIYSGRSVGIRKRTPQIIEPSVVSPGIALSTFGYSLSGGMDMDNNNYPDVLVGSAYSDATVLLRSRPIVKLTTVLTTVEPSGINLEQKNRTVNGVYVVGFNVKTCFEYRGKFVPPEIVIAYTLKLDADQQVSQLKRALFVATGTDSLNTQRVLRESIENCVTEMAYIKNEIRDKINPMTIKTEYELVDLPDMYLPAVSPILSVYSQEPTSSNLYFVNNCPGNICIPELELRSTVLQPRIVIGDTSDLVLNVSISNKGQSAFQSILTVMLPEGISYSRVANKLNNYKVGCMEIPGEIGRIDCDVGNPMPENYKLNFELVLTTNEVMGRTNTLMIAMYVGSSNPEVFGTLYNNVQNITVPVSLQFSLSLKGVSKPGQLKFSNDVPKVANYSSEEQIGDEVEHFYEIRNTNESYFGTTELVILFPLKNQDNKYLLYLTSITATEGATCIVEGAKVNELGISLLDEEKDPTRDKERASRQVDEVVEEDIVFDCDSIKCIRITCTFREIRGVSALPAGSNKVKISIKARLWAETFVDYTTSVDLISVANVTVKNSPYNIARGEDYANLQASAQVKTTANPSQLQVQQKKIKWWIYVAAIAGGLLLFILLTLILWKCGFFKRKKYQTVNQGEVD